MDKGLFLGTGWKPGPGAEPPGLGLGLRAGWVLRPKSRDLEAGLVLAGQLRWAGV